MRITDYKRISDLKPSDLILLDSDTEGTRAITALELSKKLENVMMQSDDYDMPLNRRRMTWRGKNLGSVYTDKMKQEVANGTFRNMFIGDYFTTPYGYSWIIADFDRWIQGYKDPTARITEHHLVMYPNGPIISEPMHSSATVDGGWYNTDMFKTKLPGKLQEVASVFGATYIMKHAVNKKQQKSSASDFTQLDAPTIAMIVGIDPYSTATDIFYGLQLPLFVLANDPRMMATQDMPNNNRFVDIDSTGLLSDWALNTINAQLRPFVCITGE